MNSQQQFSTEADSDLYQNVIARGRKAFSPDEDDSRNTAKRSCSEEEILNQGPSKKMKMAGEGTSLPIYNIRDGSPKLNLVVRNEEKEEKLKKRNSRQKRSIEGSDDEGSVESPKRPKKEGKTCLVQPFHGSDSEVKLASETGSPSLASNKKAKSATNLIAKDEGCIRFDAGAQSAEEGRRRLRAGRRTESELILAQAGVGMNDSANGETISVMSSISRSDPRLNLLEVIEDHIQLSEGEEINATYVESRTNLLKDENRYWFICGQPSTSCANSLENAFSLFGGSCDALNLAKLQEALTNILGESLPPRPPGQANFLTDSAFEDSDFEDSTD